MGKHNTIKKGKQKEPTLVATASAPPLPSPAPPIFAPSPPSAHHIQHPSVTIHTFDEPDEAEARSGGDPIEGAEGESWQDVGHSVDNWGDMPGNSNADLGTDWETSVAQAPTPQLPVQSVQKKVAGGRDHTKQYHPQQRPGSVGTHMSPAASNLGFSKSQQVTWTPEDGGWDNEDEWEGQGDDEEWRDDDDWNNDNADWGRQPHSATWAHAISAPSVHSRTMSSSSYAQTGGWRSWGEEARRLPKVTFDPAVPSSSSAAVSKPVLSQLQRSQALNALLNNPQQTQQPYPMPPNVGASAHPGVAHAWQQHRSSYHRDRQQYEPSQFHEQHHGHESKKDIQNDFQRVPPRQQSKRDGRRQEEVHDVWGLGDGWSDLHDEEEQQGMPQDAWGRKVRFSPGLRASMLPSSAPSVVPSAVVQNFTVNALPPNKLGLSTIPMSKTLSYAYSGTAPSTESEPGRAAMQRITDIQFVESRGEALKDVQRAFYNKQRKAADRFHWLFSPDKDERVSSLLNWINSMSFGIASFGLQKFLQTRERGALIVNAAYRPVHSPSEPAFDWVTWNQIQRTMDRILQESVGYYNPAMHIIVFVLLPSPSGNSVAIWRRKLPIPSNIRLAYQAQITQAMASLRKEYPVLVDELPAPPPPPPPKKKRKWYKLWLST